MRKSLALAMTAATTAGLAAFVPAAASAAACSPPAGGSCSDTVLTVNLSGGSLLISAPATATLTGAAGSVAAGSVVGPTSMGTTTVTDNRGTLAGWNVTAVTTGDLVSTATPSHTISLGTAALGGPLVMATGTVSASGGSILGSVAAGAGGSLNPSSAVTVATAPLASGGGSYTYAPTLTLTVPANTYAAPDYTTTITQSVQ